MDRIMHRVNTIKDLKNTSSSFGVEVDIRSNNKKFIIHHDPFKQGVSFIKWLNFYNHKILILNVKEEGLERELIKLMKKKKIKNYFFLDQSFPFLIKTCNLGEDRCAIRISEYESIETVLSLSGKVKWVWVDCFSKFPLDQKKFSILKKNGFKLCFVSPELQGKTSISKIKKFKSAIKKMNIQGDAVCTKYPDLWKY